MKVAMVLEYLDPARGGCETYTGWVATELIRRGHEVTAICHESPWRCDGLKVRPLRRRGCCRLRRARHFVADAALAAAGGDYDVIHAMLPVPGASIYQPHSGTMPARRAASLRRRFGIKWGSAWFTGKLNFYRRYLARLERRLVADPRVICLCVSDLVAQQFRRHFGRTEGVRVVFNGARVPQADAPQRDAWRRKRRAELRVGESATVFLTVATNFVLKGVAPAIDAFAEWLGARGDRTDARLVVVGRDSPRDYQRRAERRGAGDKVVFLPFSDDIFEWYSAADACVLLSWYDSCSLVTLEAARWALPSITTVYNGAAEVLAAGGGIVVSSPLDTSAVAAAMDELTDPAARRARSERCLEAGQHLTIQRHVDELIAVYEEARQRR